LRGRELGEQFFLKTLATESLASLPAAGVRDDFLMLVIDGDGGRVGLDGEMAAEVARRYTVTVAVERESKIFVNQGFGNVALVGSDRRHCSQGFGRRALLGSLIGFAMAALMAPLFEPLPYLKIHIR